MYFYEVYDSTTSALLYPVNYLRNYARMQVRWHAVGLLLQQRHTPRCCLPVFARGQALAVLAARCMEGTSAAIGQSWPWTQVDPPACRPQVRTRLMAMIDVDMLMSSSFSKEMEQPGRWVRLWRLAAGAQGWTCIAALVVSGDCTPG